MALSPADRDRLLSAIAAQPDASLEDLVSLSQAGLRAGVGVITGGQIMTGVITSEEEHAEYLDKTLAQVFTEFMESSDALELRERFEEMKKRFEGKGLFQQKASKREERARDLLKQVQSEPDEKSLLDLDEDLVREFLALRKPRAFTLEATVLWLPSQQTSVEYGTVRVQLSHVAAWWLLEGALEPEDSEKGRD
jgi:predicted thioredoxin/glutaredoxin